MFLVGRGRVLTGPVSSPDPTIRPARQKYSSLRHPWPVVRRFPQLLRCRLAARLRRRLQQTSFHCWYRWRRSATRCRTRTARKATVQKLWTTSHRRSRMPKWGILLASFWIAADLGVTPALQERGTRQRGTRLTAMWRGVKRFSPVLRKRQQQTFHYFFDRDLFLACFNGRYDFVYQMLNNCFYVLVSHISGIHFISFCVLCRLV